MNPVARARHVLARRPWLYWSAVLVLAAVAAWAVAAGAAGVDDARRAWGTTTDVVVATAADLAPGEALAGRTEVRPRPSPAVPASALTSVPGGAVARQHIAAGESVVGVDVTSTAGPAGLIPAGWAAAAVAEAVPTGAAVGDHVTAVSGGIVLAADGLVVETTADALLVAVPAADAPAIARAATAGDLALLIVP